MADSFKQPASWDELFSFVHTTLCERENLIEEQFKTHAQPVYRDEKICAVEFELHALRNVRLAALWAMDKNELFFYDAKGERFQKLKLNKWISYPLEKVAV
jgi:hypothetical protein